MSAGVKPLSVREEPGDDGQLLRCGDASWAIWLGDRHLWRCDDLPTAVATVGELLKVRDRGGDLHDWLLNEWHWWLRGRIFGVFPVPHPDERPADG